MSDDSIKEMVKNWLNNNYQKHFLIFEGENKVGLAQIYNIDIVNRKCNLGILIDPIYSNKGIGSSTLKLLISICFQNLNLHKLEVNIYKENVASIKLVEKAGFRQEGVLKHSIFKHGYYKDICMYGLINSNN